ncbi:LuxR C-terminal-related transcriptional regulator [Laceyella putida]|uniref:LuxR C-terminal-related transcriptional regulator n=1 Tax=Laceyella putida TaxID=110101 RepID=A0ABW2RHB5_9BACL
MKRVSFLSPPLLSPQEWEKIFHSVKSGTPECLTQWKIKLSTFPFSASQKQAAHQLFQYLLEGIDQAADFPTYEKNFSRLVLQQIPLLQLSQVIAVIDIFEEILFTLLLQKLSHPDILTSYRWLHSLALTLSYSVANIETNPPLGENTIPDNPAKHREAVVRLDELLLTARSLEQMLTRSVRFITKVSGFERGALFWYSPLTQTVEGIYGYGVDIGDIRRVRDMEHNISGITQAIKGNRPIYIRDAQLYLPKHYVEQFGLTALMAAVLRGGKGQNAGFLLLDKRGRAFDPDPEVVQQLAELMSRVSLNLGSRLYENDFPSPAASSPLTVRETKILQMIADGQSTKLIGEALHISEYTAAEYAHSVLKKLKAANRAEAVAKGLRQGLIR